MIQHNDAFVLQARVGTLYVSEMLILTLQIIESFCQAFQSGFGGARSAVVAGLRGRRIATVAQKKAGGDDLSILVPLIEHHP